MKSEKSASFESQTSVKIVEPPDSRSDAPQAKITIKTEDGEVADYGKRESECSRHSENNDDGFVTKTTTNATAGRRASDGRGLRKSLAGMMTSTKSQRRPGGGIQAAGRRATGIQDAFCWYKPETWRFGQKRMAPEALSPFPRRLSEPMAVNKLADLNTKQLRELVANSSAQKKTGVAPGRSSAVPNKTNGEEAEDGKEKEAKPRLSFVEPEETDHNAIEDLQLDEYVSLFSIRDQTPCTSRLSYILRHDVRRQQAEQLSYWEIMAMSIVKRMWYRLKQQFPLPFAGTTMTCVAWVIFATSIYTFFSCTLHFAFFKDPKFVRLLDIMSEIDLVLGIVYFTLAVAMRFISTFPEWNSGMEYCTYKSIAIHTLQSRIVQLDVLSVLFCFLVEIFRQNPVLHPRLFQALQLGPMVRCWRLTYPGHALRLLKYQTVWSLFTVVLYISLFEHLLTCIYWLNLPEWAVKEHEAWIVEEVPVITEIKWEHMYMHLLHQTAFLLMAQDRRSFSQEEETFITLLGPVGAMIMGWIFGQINLLVQRRANVESQHLGKMETVSQAMHMLQLPKDLCNRIFAYLEYLDMYQNDVMFLSLMRSLNAPLQLELRLCTYFSLIVRAQFFHDSTAQAIMRIVMILEDQYYSPGDYLIRMGELGNEMFFVIHGQAEALVGNPSLSVIQTYSDSSYFGEIALLTRHPRKAWVRAVTFLVVAVLDKGRFDGIANEHPDAWRSMFWRLKHVLKVASVTASGMKKRLLAKYGTLYEAFNGMDRDGSGELDFAEFAEAMHETLEIEIDDSRMLFHQIDKDGSGAVNAEEFVLYFAYEALTEVEQAVAGRNVEQSLSTYGIDLSTNVKLKDFVSEMKACFYCVPEDAEVVYGTVATHYKGAANEGLPWQLLIEVLTRAVDLERFVEESKEHERNSVLVTTGNRGSVLTELRSNSKGHHVNGDSPGDGPDSSPNSSLNKANIPPDLALPGSTSGTGSQGVGSVNKALFASLDGHEAQSSNNRRSVDSTCSDDDDDDDDDGPPRAEGIHGDTISELQPLALPGPAAPKSPPGKGPSLQQNLSMQLPGSGGMNSVPMPGMPPSGPTSVPMPGMPPGGPGSVPLPGGGGGGPPRRQSLAAIHSMHKKPNDVGGFAFARPAPSSQAQQLLEKRVAPGAQQGQMSAADAMRANEIQPQSILAVTGNEANAGNSVQKVRSGGGRNSISQGLDKLGKSGSVHFGRELSRVMEGLQKACGSLEMRVDSFREEVEEKHDDHTADLDRMVRVMEELCEHVCSGLPESQDVRASEGPRRSSRFSLLRKDSKIDAQERRVSTASVPEVSQQGQDGDHEAENSGFEQDGPSFFMGPRDSTGHRGSGARFSGLHTAEELAELSVMTAADMAMRGEAAEGEDYDMDDIYYQAIAGETQDHQYSSANSSMLSSMDSTMESRASQESEDPPGVYRASQESEDSPDLASNRFTQSSV